MTTCEHVERTHALADGELTDAVADEARDHLAGCETCQNEFSDALQLDAAVTEAPANVISIAWFRQRKVQLASAALAAAAGVAIYVAVSRPKPPADEHPQIAAIALAPNRGVEARLAWSDASAYRPYDVPRGDAPHENVPLSVLGDVEKRGDLHGVAVLAMLDGDRKQAASYFERAGNGPDVQLDRAALALGDGDPAKALGLVDAVLEKDPANPVALWNRALALRDLGLPRAAAAAFHDVAKRNEPGWAAEATARANKIDAATDAERDLTIRVLATGPQLAKDGTGLSLDDAKKLPGFSRLLFYDALRSAPTAERIAKLRPLAEAMDQATHTGDLVAAIERAKPRGALAETYADIVAKQAAGDWDHLPPREPYLAALRAAHADDLLIGALIKLSADGTVVDAKDVAELAKLTAASPDRWMQLLGLEQQGASANAAGELAKSEVALLRGHELCLSGGPAFRCMKIATKLAEVDMRLARTAESRVETARAWKLSREHSEWLAQLSLLAQMTTLANLSDDQAGKGLSLVRAYTDEIRLRGPDERKRYPDDPTICEREVFGRYVVANVLVDQMRLADAKRELVQAPKCPGDEDIKQAVEHAQTHAEIARGIGSPADRSAVREEIAKLRASKHPPPGLAAALDNAEGRIVVETDHLAGEKLFRRSIETAKATPDDSYAIEATGWSFAGLAMSQARRGDGVAALQTLADEVGATVPATCVIGLVADDRVVGVVRDAKGTISVSDVPRTSTAMPPPSDLGAKVHGCDNVEVLARPPFHGIAHLLPPSIAWRYRSAHPAVLGARSERRVVIADVEPPASLELPRLATWSTTGDVISGSSATPARVLAAISDADVVTIHAHGIVDQLDASYLALSAAADGRYALTARDVRAAKFRTSPVIILAACRASQAAPVLQQTWSLPAAFIHQGARAVIASASPIPDAEAAPFFDDFERRLAGGQSASIALRDARTAWHRGDWVNDLVVFE